MGWGMNDVHRAEWIAGLLERVDFVEWDRYTVMNHDNGKQSIDVYGWIDRPDEYKDFVWTRFYPDDEPDPTLEYTTSSDEYSKELTRIWFGEDAVSDHNPCRRVENTFDIDNAIEL